MGEFFHRWRRTFGLLSLALGVVVSTLWLRSHYFSDSVTVSKVGVISQVGAFSWTWFPQPKLNAYQTLDLREVQPSTFGNGRRLSVLRVNHYFIRCYYWPFSVSLTAAAILFLCPIRDPLKKGTQEAS